LKKKRSEKQKKKREKTKEGQEWKLLSTNALIPRRHQFNRVVKNFFFREFSTAAHASIAALISTIK